MKANPGGHIDTADVIGRDGLVARIWGILGRQSLILSAERRIGKTCVLKKMMAEAPAECVVMYRDLEQVHTKVEFVELVLHDVGKLVGWTHRSLLGLRKYMGKLGGTEIPGGIKLPHGLGDDLKTLFTVGIEALVGHEGQRAILLWDEVPSMLQHIEQRDGPQDVMEILDLLRAMRQTHAGLRMVFTGSIGLHHVIDGLREQGYTNAPFNDMYILNVPPLAPADAKDLARRLLNGEGLDVARPDEVAEAMAGAVDCIPYYIHHVVDQLAQRHEVVSVEAVSGVVLATLTDPQDPWHFRHYLDRLDHYYSKEDRKLVLAVLDALASGGTPLGFDEVFNLIKASVVTDDKELALNILTRLQLDHYLAQDCDGRYHFTFQLIRRWWRFHRRLQG